MGHNRSGVRRHKRLKRRKRELERLAEKAAPAGEGSAPAAEGRPPGLLKTAKDVAKGFVRGLMHGSPEKKGPAPRDKPS